MNNINIVLVEPEIPQNTGNIARTCACTGAALHLVRPLGFEIDDKKLKRAGLDYWHFLNITYYDSLEDFMDKTKDKKKFFCSTKASKTYAQVEFPKDCYLVFGKETKGLPEKLLYENMDSCIRIPMINGARSLNLSNSVAIIAFEALKQQGFENLEETGHLTMY
ncbi:MAG: tRNA (uridine(34)/cytosine(34)/5-carboxymethylaminomethyluridine(34)-2'-O)-methyltransferase TrmL [Ruminococcaceae bacterium]|nr:tRNA (uridine(34)/cytosine(34)/5-carboxymethylaminomethyluridine(34)-2'-O)-methyltransferase TrmL [Oscillospiraceae bacterium]